MVGLRRRHVVSNNNPGASIGLSATATLNPTDHANRPILLTGTDAQTYTLPAASGSGNKYTFYVLETNSNLFAITAPGTDEHAGLAWQSDGNLDVAAASSWSALVGDDYQTISIGGDLAELGSWVECVDVAAGLYITHGILVGSNNTPATVWTT